jgi:hypothetical protein
VPARGNCLLWALIKFAREGGYILMRRSRWGPFPHFLWAPPDLSRVESYVPHDPRRRLLPKVWFRGHVRIGDP